jgi:hypothetical protein
VENTPIRRSDVQALGTNYMVFGAVVPKVLSEKDLLDPKLWVNVAVKLMAGCEVRVTDVDCSFMARVFVTYANQHDIRIQVLEHHVFETPSDTEDEEYFVKQRGQLKWCLMKKGNPEPIQTNIATKHEAEKQLNEYLQTLAR